MENWGNWKYQWKAHLRTMERENVSFYFAIPLEPISPCLLYFPSSKNKQVYWFTWRHARPVGTWEVKSFKSERENALDSHCCHLKMTLVIRKLKLIAKGMKLVPEGMQELKLISKNHRVNVSSGNKILTVSNLKIATFCCIPPLQNCLLTPSQGTWF